MAVLAFSVLVDRLIRTLKTQTCPFCENTIADAVNAPLCPACEKELLMREPLPLIAGASRPIYAACGFPHALKKRIYQLKFYNNASQLPLLVDVLVHYASKVPQLRDTRFTVVPIPRRSATSSNHVPSIFRAVASHFGWNFREKALVWARETPRQHDLLARHKRLANIKGAFVANPHFDADLASAKAILVVDDIMTTGGTMREAIQTLAQSHPNVPIFGLTLSHVPFAIGRHPS